MERAGASETKVFEKGRLKYQWFGLSEEYVKNKEDFCLNDPSWVVIFILFGENEWGIIESIFDINIYTGAITNQFSEVLPKGGKGLVKWAYVACPT